MRQQESIDRRNKVRLNHRVLLAETDRYVADLIQSTLSQAGYEVSTASTSAEIVNYCSQGRIDLILLDSRMTLLDKFSDGYRTLQHCQIPLILMTSAAQNEYQLDNCLLYEVDDYISKPFSPRDLLLRITRTIQRNASGHRLAEHEYIAGNFRLDRRQRQATIDKKRIKLTSNECHLLDALLQNANELTPKEELVKAVWKSRFYNDENVLRVTMRRLRNKIEQDPSNPTYLITVYGKGYRLNLDLSANQPS